jgi:propanediol dehydratase large subunit
MGMPTYNLRRQRVEPAKLAWLRSGEGTLTRLHAEAAVGLARIEDEQALLIAAARRADPIADHLLATRYRGRVWTAAECEAETARRQKAEDRGQVTA